MCGPDHFRQLGFNSALYFCVFKREEKKMIKKKVIKVADVLLREGDIFRG